MVASYLVHHSYCATAEAFAKSTDQAVQEELASIKNRQSEWLPAPDRKLVSSPLRSKPRHCALAVGSITERVADGGQDHC